MTTQDKKQLAINVIDHELKYPDNFAERGRLYPSWYDLSRKERIKYGSAARKLLTALN